MPRGGSKSPVSEKTSSGDRTLFIMDWIITMRLTSFIRSYPMKIDLAVLSRDRARRFKEEIWIST